MTVRSPCYCFLACACIESINRSVKLVSAIKMFSLLISTIVCYAGPSLHLATHVHRPSSGPPRAACKNVIPSRNTKPPGLIVSAGEARTATSNEAEHSATVHQSANPYPGPSVSQRGGAHAAQPMLLPFSRRIEVANGGGKGCEYGIV